MITTEIKNKILAAIKANRANYPSDAKHAALPWYHHLGIQLGKERPDRARAERCQLDKHSENLV